jgi:hypothetical protein
VTVSISSASVQEDLMTEILHIASSSSVPTACHAEAGLLLVQQERSAPCDDQPVVTGAVLFHAEADERDFFDLPDLRCLECGGWGPCGGLDDDLPATPPDDGGTWGVCGYGVGGNPEGADTCAEWWLTASWATAAYERVAFA